MGAHSQRFYGTKLDLEEILCKVECKSPPLKFAPKWAFPTDEVIIYDSLLSFPNLGIANNPSSIANRAYYVLERERPVVIVTHRSQEHLWYSCEIGERSAVIFRPGGVLSDGTLILSEVNVMSEDPPTLKLFELFRREIKLSSTMVHSVPVCKEAMKLLDNGWILTDMANAAIKRQLKRPPKTTQS